MGGLLTELAKKLAERWLSLLVLPGALFIAIAATATTLGHRHALNVADLVHKITAFAKDPALFTLGGQIYLLIAFLGAAAATGLLAQALGSMLERLALAANWRAWPWWVRRPVTWWVCRRQDRWENADRAYQSELRGCLTWVDHGLS